MKQQRHKFKFIVLLIACMLCGAGYAQQNTGATNSYKKRVLETTEVDFLSSYYSQNGDNAAVTGGIGTEELTDVTGTIALPSGTEMVMPGDNIQFEVNLGAPIAMEEGLRFAIREGGRTVGAGVVSKIIE